MTISIKTYFCPACGRGYESSECSAEPRALTGNLRCPKCDALVQTSGGSFMIVGFLIWFFTGLVLDGGTMQQGGFFVGSILGGVGIVRLIRQVLARRRGARV